MMRLNLHSIGLGRKLQKIPAPYKVAVIVVLNVAIFAAFFFLVLSDQFEVKKRLDNDYQALRRDLDRITTIKNNMPKYRAEYTSVQEKLKDVLIQLPERKDIPNLLRNISSIGTESGTRVKYFEPKALVNKEFYGELPFDIKYSGAFQNIGYFFDGVRKLDRIIDITSFSLEAKGVPGKMYLEGQCQAKAYVYLHEAPKEKKEAKGGPPAKK